MMNEWQPEFCKITGRLLNAPPFDLIKTIKCRCCLGKGKQNVGGTVIDCRYCEKGYAEYLFLSMPRILTSAYLQTENVHFINEYHNLTSIKTVKGGE
jgi:hypothetical protein